jgi:hypothetical protein
MRFAISSFVVLLSMLRAASASASFLLCVVAASIAHAE